MDEVDLWKTEYAKLILRSLRIKGVRLCSFDQCRLGAETTKPTKFAYFNVDLAGLDGFRCDHPVQDFTKSDGTKYRARHESLVQRWRTNDKGQRERASKALGEYPARPNEALSAAMAYVDTPRVKKFRELRDDPLPRKDFHTADLDVGIKTDRDLENEKAIGGMRNPMLALDKLPKSKEIGKAVATFLKDAALHPSVQGAVDDMTFRWHLASPARGMSKARTTHPGLP